jgi:hypothetical protein
MDTSVNGKKAIRGALQGLEDFDLYTDDEWEYALRNALPTAPYRVVFLNAPGSFYFIVPFELQGTIRAVVVVDGERFHYLQSAVSDPDVDAIIIMGEDDAEKSILSQQMFEFHDTKVFVTKNDLGPERPLVWKPCAESFSPLYPFYRFTVNTPGPLRVLYVRAYDGAVFTELTDNVGGA